MRDPRKISDVAMKSRGICRLYRRDSDQNWG